MNQEGLLHTLCDENMSIFVATTQTVARPISQNFTQIYFSKFSTTLQSLAQVRSFTDIDRDSSSLRTGCEGARFDTVVKGALSDLFFVNPILFYFIKNKSTKLSPCVR